MKNFRIGSVVLVLILLLAGCGSRRPKSVVKSGYQIYYLNSEETNIISKSYVPKSTGAEDMVDEFIERLATTSDTLEYKCSKPETVKILDYYIENRQLNVKFDASYDMMSNTTEVLMRAAYVRTLVQIPGVDLVSFYIGDEPIVDQKGDSISAMNEETFVENNGSDIYSYEEADLVLYFANKEGDKLVQVKKSLVHSSSISLEKLIMEQLIKGPSSSDKNGFSTIAEGTKLLGISVKDGICYVNLSSDFLKSTNEVTEEVQIYSIVNSLAELSTVSKVQIAINGISDRMFLEKVSFKTIFERNLDIIQNTEE